MDNTANNKRIAKNTIVLYLRMIVVMAISLFTSRVVLTTLGVEDYGIYNVVGGFVAMFSLLTGSLSNAISRYITFELGRENYEKLRMVFSNAIIVQIILAIVVFIFSEIIGLWFLNNKMQIPEGRMVAANWVLHCSILTFVVNLINIPYQACIIAHEKMTAFAYISILETILKLGVVLCLYYNWGDNLIAYSLMLLFVAILIRFINGVYCNRTFSECIFKWTVDKPLIKEMTSMASWNFLGAGGAILGSHGVNILINLFFGVVFNAARGIAVQVNGAVNQFVSSFTTAMNPQITKLYSVGNKDEMFQLVFRGTKLAFFLMLVISCPIIVETPTILRLWLKVVPDYAVVFVRLALVQSLISTLSVTLFTVAMATGDIKKYQLIVGSLGLSVFFFTYAIYKLGGSVESAYIVGIVIELAILVARLYVLHGLVGLDLNEFLKKVIYRVSIVVVPTLLLHLIMIHLENNHSVSVFLFNLMVSITTVSSFSFLFGMDAKERGFILYQIKEKIHKT